MSDFDNAANVYDQTFTNSCVGKAQRTQVWHYLKQLQIPAQSRILEINCGTGEDAFRWQQAGYTILATDLSPEMIRVSQSKFPTVPFHVMNMLDLHNQDSSFDLIFSNFGGLNCLSPEYMRELMQKAAAKLPADGKFIAVIMGKKCVWERLYFLSKGKWKHAFRRNTSKPVAIPVDGTMVQTWYYTPRNIRQLATPWFTVKLVKPVGFCIPPSWMAPYFEKRPGLFKRLIYADRVCTSGLLSDYADHYLICLTRNAQPV
jgi:SAM-dependent methyltransferase